MQIPGHHACRQAGARNDEIAEPGMTKIEKLAEGFEEMGVTTALVDLDDTLVDTHAVYLYRMERAVRIMAGEDGAEALHQAWLARITENRSRFHVNPQVLYQSFAEVTGEFTDDEARGQAIEEIRCIYEEDTPPVFPGVDAFLRDLRQAGLKVCVVTHASPEWTAKKLSANNLASLVDQVYCIDIDGPKDEDAWAAVYEKEGVTVNQVIVVGDSIVSDVWPNLNLGLPADRIVRVTSKFKFGSQEVPEFVLQADGVSVALESFLN